MKRKRNVLVILGWHDHRILMGIARYANQVQWHLPSRHMYDVSVPTGWNGDGLLARWGTSPELWDFVRRQSPRQPTVIVGRDLGGLKVPQVYHDDIAIGQLAARHFLERGHTNFAWYSPIGVAAAARRLVFRDALRQAGFDCKFMEPPKEISQGKAQDPVPLRRWLIGQLKRLPKPLALFVVDDRIAAEVTEACLEARLAIPQSVAVLGVGNLEIPCKFSQVPISSVEVDFDMMGYRSAELLDGLMHGEKAPPGPVLLPAMGVICRRSTDMKATLHPKVREAIEFIKDNFQSPLQVQDIADSVLISTRALERLFARELRQSPAEQVLQIRIERVKALLRETDMKISRIAESTGFESERNLRRAFGRKTGMPPLEFRKRHRIVKPEGE